MSNKISKIICLLLAAVLTLSVFTACGKKGNGGDAEPTASPEADPSINDAPATTDVIAKVDGKEIFANIYNYFLYDALYSIDFSGLDIPAEATDEEAIKLRLDYLKTEKEPGLTYYQDAVNNALSLCQKFKISEILAEEGGHKLTDEEIEKYNDSVDETADSLLLYYGESEGATTRDEIVYAAVGMNVNDYKKFYISQLEVSAWTDAIKSELFTPTEEALKAYYDAHENIYRTVTVRKLFVPFETVDEEGNALSEEVIAANKIAALELAESYKKIIVENNLDLGKFSAGFSGETEATNQGLADINGQSTLDHALVSWATVKTSPSEDIEIIESTSGYYLARVEGITSYSEDSPVTLSSTISSTAIQSSVLSACKDQMYEDYLTEKAKEERFALTDVNSELADSMMAKYLTETFG